MLLLNRSLQYWIATAFMISAGVYKKTAADAFCPLRATPWSVTASFSPTISAAATSRQPPRSCRSSFLSFSAGNETIPSSSSSSLADIPQVVALDLVGLLIAFQLLGLVDALNAPDFYRNGGWLQPPPSILDEDSTLPSLAGRFALNAIVWILSVVTAPTAVNVVGLKNLQEKGKDTPLFGSSLGLLFGWFLLLRVIVALAIASVIQQQPAFEMILQEFYFVGLGIITTRFVVGRSR